MIAHKITQQRLYLETISILKKSSYIQILVRLLRDTNMKKEKAHIEVKKSGKVVMSTLSLAIIKMLPCLTLYLCILLRLKSLTYSVHIPQITPKSKPHVSLLNIKISMQLEECSMDV